MTCCSSASACEVGIDGEVERERRRHARLHVDAGAQVLVELGFADATQAAADQERFDAEVAALPQRGESREVALGRRSIDGVGARDGRPIAHFVLAPHAAREVDAPDLAVARLEPQRLERDAKLRGPAVRTTPSLNPPDRVSIGVDVAAFVRHLGIRLGASGVGREHEAVAPIGERVEEHFEDVLVASDEVLANLVDDDA